MKIFRIRIITEEPVILLENPSSLNANTLEYIPGKTLKGAIASFYIKNFGENEFFNFAFIKNNVHFSNFYPVHYKYHFLEEDIYPFSFIHYTCKRYSGIPSECEIKEEKHGVINTLKNLLTNKEIICPTCGEPLKIMKGYYFKSGNQFVEVQIRKNFITHTGIDFLTSTVKESILYSYEVIEKDNAFIGEIKFINPHEEINSFKNFLENNMFKIGKGRTRGYGKISLEILSEKEPNKDYEEFKKRLIQFNEILNLKDYKVITITLLSDVLIYDNYLRYKRIIDEKYLNERFNLNELKYLYRAFTNRKVTYWNELWGIFERPFLVIGKGSVFVFKVKNEDWNENLFKKLYNLELKGIGERKEIGFGKIIINNYDFLEGKNNGKK